ncbi:type VI secretion system ATPase TssH [Rhizobium mongolense]|uniref:Type VI secretion system protein VasG n=1 Tax=Rhizobium mongolense TaxID=57676 RepID=A0A7W6RNB7_9HYPH|nr:type VI secretion system ATPase TssH [Rhizobium mongolense]MBB4275607.1 type VI secretion system protein VasG [Rhizobium mongolense]
MPQIDLNRLIRTLEPSLRVGLETAASIAVRHQHPVVDIAHWLRALIDIADVAPVLEEVGISLQSLRSELDATIGDVAREEGRALALSQNLLTLAREAWLVASLQFGRNRVLVADLLSALISDSTLRMLVRAIAPSLRDLDGKALEKLLETTEPDAAGAESAILPAAGRRLPNGADDNEFLRLYTRDMTADARAGRIDPVIGRNREQRQLIDILMRRRQNNPILVGEAGVGKTAVAEALALEIADGNVPDKLKAVRLFTLDLSLLQAGAGIKGEFERRLHGVVDAVKASVQPIILFIDEAHGLIGAGGQSGQGDAANILKPALARGELRTIAATTWSEYKRFIEKDAALTRRFQTVHVQEPDEETAIRMLRGVAETFAAHHKVRIRDEALIAAVRLSARYLPARQLPDKAISLIDTAAASVSLARQTIPEPLRNLRSEHDLLEAEATWLSGEPDTGENTERLARIEAEIARISSEIDALQAKYDEELRLVKEADRLEAVFAPKAVEDIPEPGEEASNVAPFPASGLSAQGARAAFAVAERKLQQTAGEAPLVPRVVDKDIIATIVARWTGIPVGKLLADQVETAKSLDDRLKERIVGQDPAIGRIADTMRAARAGLSDPRRPPAVFLLLGMSGTGKTETALSLADLYYGGSQQLTTINMSEFKEEHKISMLLGSPPGYVGYGEGGVLTEAVRRRPYGVLLLDEIDKAHSGVQEIFYQVFDKGTLRDGEGRDIDFKNTTIVMTANAGSELLAALAADPDTMPEGEALEALLLPELQKHFKPAFLGRTIILPFLPLRREALSAIVDMQIGRIRDRVTATYGTALSLSDEAREALVSGAKTSVMGARAIEVMIARELLPVLSTFFLDRMSDGRKVSHVLINFDSGRFGIEPISAADEKEFAGPDELRRADEAVPDGEGRSASTTDRKANAP